MQKILSTLKTLIIVFALTIGMSYLFAWTGPTASAPNDNTPAPINASEIAQVKAGQISLGADGVDPVANPMLDVFGNISGQGLALSGDGQTLGDFCKVHFDENDQVVKDVCLSTLSDGAGSIETATSVYGFSNMTVFDYASASGETSSVSGGNGSYTFQVPDGITKVKVRAWGSGGKGYCSVNGGVGGGGGGYGEGVYTVQPGQDYSVKVGGSLANPYISSGVSSFGSFIVSNPGADGTVSYSTVTAGGTSNGQFNINGENGLPNGGGSTFSGGSSPMGGTAGVVPGGGGSGGSSRVGGCSVPSAAGRVVIEY